MRRKALQQGQADGMCGLYAVLNLLNMTEWKTEKPSLGLRYLLECCRQLGFLTPEYLTDGFEDHHLKKIIDLQIDNYRLNFETYFQSDVASILPELSCQDLMVRVVSKRGFAITQNQSGDHWLLVAGVKRTPMIFDSDDRSGVPVPLNKRRLAEPNGWGLVVLPKKRSPLMLEI